VANVSLNCALGSPSRVAPLLSGAVTPANIDLTVELVPLGKLFWQMPHSEPYDVAEMSLTGYIWARQHGKAWTALPVFPAWVYGCHADTLVHASSKIAAAADLRGKRVGVPEYAVTALSWVRDAWRQESSLLPSDVIWVEERTPALSNYGPWGYTPPADVKIEAVPPDTCLSEMLVAGEIDAVARYFGRPQRAGSGPAADRSPITLRDLAKSPELEWMYADRKAAAHAYADMAGAPQPIHCVVVKDEVLSRDPWVAASLVAAFEEAARLTQGSPSVKASFDFDGDEQARVFGPSFTPVGLGEHTVGMLNRLLDRARWDGLVTDDSARVEDLFYLER
jgi:4,5-dihydroxyphthalate decarboxylase